MTNDITRAIEAPTALNEPSIPDLADKFLAKLQALAGKVLDAYKEAGAPNSPIYTSMCYLIHVPGVADMEPILKSDQCPTAQSPAEILKVLQKGHGFDNENSGFGINKANIVYYEPSKDEFMRLRTCLLQRFSYIDLASIECVKSEKVGENTWGIGMGSRFSLTPEGDSPILNLSICPDIHPTGSYNGCVLNLRNTISTSDRNRLPSGKYSIFNWASQNSILGRGEEGLEDPIYQVARRDLMRRLMTYELSDAGSIAPIAMLALTHLSATADLIARPNAERAKELEILLS